MPEISKAALRSNDRRSQRLSKKHVKSISPVRRPVGDSFTSATWPPAMFARMQTHLITERIVTSAEYDMVATRLQQKLVDCSTPLEDAEYQIFKAALRHSPFCSTLNDDEVLELANSAQLFEFAAGDEVVKEGEAGTHLFLVKSGSYVVTVGDCETLTQYKQGATFGEVSLIHGSPRWATITAEVLGQVWGVALEAVRLILLQMAHRSFKENMKLLERVQIFNVLDDQQMTSICQELVVQIYATGSTIIRQGDSGEHIDSVFIIKSGAVQVTKDDQMVRTLGVGDYFGELALLYRRPRSATVVASMRTSCVAFKRSVLARVLGDVFYLALFQNVVFQALKTTLTFSQFSDEQLRSLAGAVLIKDFPARSVVFLEEKETRGLRYFIVLDGEVVVGTPGNDDVCARLSCGDGFGDEYLKDTSRPFQHKVENASDFPCKLALLSTEAVKSLAATSDVEELLDDQEKMAMLRKVYVFRHLSKPHCKLIAKSLRTLSKRKGEAVIVEGEMGSQFFVIRSGELLVVKQGRTLRTLGKSDYFGERGLLYDEPRTASVLVNSSKADLLFIDKKIFTQILDGKMRAHLEQRIKLQNRNFDLDDLREVRIIGRGTFGVVKHVTHRESGHPYALKCISRVQAVRNREQEHLQLEREILLENDHPFIVKVVKTFKDRRYIYFLQELVIGGELYAAIRELGLLSRAQAQFYVASMILALESLHMRDITFRDLKPENVLLDSHGFIKLIDFGCARKLRGITFTLLGTPHYMAPEVINGQGYRISCDVWSVGVCLYEFMCGPLPFGNDTDDHLEVFRHILQSKLTFPSVFKDRAARRVIRGLLRRPVEERLRLSDLSGDSSVRCDEFFCGFSWDRLLSRQLDPPLVPGEPAVEEGGAMDKDVVTIDEHALEMDIIEDGWDKDF